MPRCNSITACALAAVALAGLPGCSAISTFDVHFSPQVRPDQARAKTFQASLEWQVATPGHDVYMGTMMHLGWGLPRKDNRALTFCNNGYLGAQFHVGGYYTLLWSMMGREEGQIVPVGKYCHYDCFDCHPPNRRDFQCKRDDYKLKTGIVYTFVMQMEMENTTGAMWSVSMVDPTAADKGHPVEVGRVFFKDREFSLDNCRSLDLKTGPFQEQFNHKDVLAHFKASWSGFAFSGVMQPEGKGYCAGPALRELQGLSLFQCKNTCAFDKMCRFASYTASDYEHAKVDGSHCFLFSECKAKATYLADIWWTHAKHEEFHSVRMTGFGGWCAERNCCWQLPGGAGSHAFLVPSSTASGELQLEFQCGAAAQIPRELSERGCQHPKSNVEATEELVLFM